MGGATSTSSSARGSSHKKIEREKKNPKMSWFQFNCFINTKCLPGKKNFYKNALSLMQRMICRDGNLRSEENDTPIIRMFIKKPFCVELGTVLSCFPITQIHSHM